MSPTLKKVRKQYITFKEKIMPWYLKTIMFFPWFTLLSIILVFEPGSDSNSIVILDDIPNLGNRVAIKEAFAFVMIATIMFILRNRMTANSEHVRVYVEEVFSAFTAEGKKMLTEELKSAKLNTQVFSTVTAASAFVLSILSITFNTTSKVLSEFATSDASHFLNTVYFFAAIVFYFWMFLLFGFFNDLAYREIEIILKEIEYGKTINEDET
ncbi:hypothetical protein [Leuconostoc citreum]|uniref:hypothetical protein n=1 Tax=Leuconostoc citreum TaxID=33964 RepID=UPI0032DF43CF